MISCIKNVNIKYILIKIKISIFYLEKVKSYISHQKNKQLNILNRNKKRYKRNQKMVKYLIKKYLILLIILEILEKELFQNELKNQEERQVNIHQVLYYKKNNYKNKLKERKRK